MCLWIYKRLLTCLLLFIVFVPVNATASILKNQTAIDEFYLSQDGEPLWIKKTKLNRSGKELLKVLELSWQNGLNPNTYHVNTLSNILDKRGRFNKNNGLEIEVLLTDGYINYVRDLSGMRINARDMGLRRNHWRQKISVIEALSYIDVNKKNMAEFLSLREPQTNTYQRLKSELIKLTENEGRGYKSNLTFRVLARPMRSHNEIPKLRDYFDLDKVEQQNRYTYDAKLVKAVMGFQAEQGLKPDGIIGKQTLRALNYTNLDKIKQIIVNMERLRWVDDVKPERFVIVNIPSATLWAVDNGKVRFEMPVIVGRKKRPTNSFITKIHGVRFNPTWTVPKTIKAEDILPQLQSDPNYLADKGMELFDGYGSNAPTLDPFAIDWNNLDEAELHSLRMVQVPGKHNPLGSIRILMPNEHNIYLHDTNNKGLFSRADRAKSSGCIRMKHPENIAMFALEKRQHWNKKAMLDVLEEGSTKDIYTPEKLPVYLMYYTVWLGGKNRIIYGYDVYNHDSTLLQLLEKLDGFYIIGDNEDRIAQFVD